MLSDNDRDLYRKLESEIVSSCKKCGGYGYIFKNECDCRKRLNFELEKMKANIPVIYRQYNLDILEKSRAKAFTEVKKYIKNIRNHKKNSTGVLLSGDVQVGKATIASVILMELIKLGYNRCDFMEFSFLMKELYRQTRHAYNDEELDSRLHNAEFLVINGISSEHCTYTDKSLLEVKFIDILKMRITLGYPTILTTSSVDLQGHSVNLKNELKEVFGSRLISLLNKYFIEIKLPDEKK